MAERAATSRRHTALALLSLAQVFASAAAGVVITVAAPTLVSMTRSDAIGGWAQTSTIAGAACLSIVVARAAARWGRRPSLVGAFGLAAAGALIAAASAESGAWLLNLLGLWAIGAGTVAALALRYAAFELAGRPSESARNVGIVLASATVGSLIGPTVVTTMTGTEAIEEPYLLAALFYLTGAVTCRWVLPSAVAAASAPVREAAEPSTRQPALPPILTMVAGHMAMVALMGMAPVHLSHDDAPAPTVGWVMSAHLAAMYGASPLFAVVVRRVGTTRSGLVALAMSVIACCLLQGTGGEPFGFGAGLVCLGLAWSLGLVSSSVALARVPARRRLRLQGRGDLALNIGGGASSLLAGLALATVGYDRLAVIVGTGLIAVASIVAILEVRNHRGGLKDAPSDRTESDRVPPYRRGQSARDEAGSAAADPPKTGV